MSATGETKQIVGAGGANEEEKKDEEEGPMEGPFCLKDEQKLREQFQKQKEKGEIDEVPEVSHNFVLKAIFDVTAKIMSF